jgi:hypothetical protein
MTKFTQEISKEDIILILEDVKRNPSYGPDSAQQKQFNDALLFYLKEKNADKKCIDCTHCGIFISSKTIYKCLKIRGKLISSEDEYEDNLKIKKNQQACNFYEEEQP